MKLKKSYFITALFLSAGLQIFAQKETATTSALSIKEEKSKTDTDEENNEQRKQNFLKINLTSLALKNYSVQFERTLSRKFSAAIALRVMPKTAVPFRSQITKTIGTVSSNTTDLINNLNISNYALTPELRIYLSKKGFGQGFYIAPFYRLSTYKTNSLKVNFIEDNGTQNSLKLSGNLTSNTAGILFGAQWNIGKQMCIDWSIAGPHYGIGRGNFSSPSSKPLSQSEQDQLHRQIDNVQVPFSQKTIYVDANSVNLALSGSWAGIRAALSFGIKF
jgi:hypothetical protein